MNDERLAAIELELESRLDAAERQFLADVSVDPDLFEQMAAEAESASEHALAGRAWYLAARVCVEIGSLSVALAHIDRAAGAFVLAGRPLDAARTELGRMHVLDDLGRHADAISLGHVALERLSALSGSTSDYDNAFRARLEAALHENIGAASGYTGDHVGALEAYGVAEQTYGRHGLHDDRFRCLANAGIELVEVGRAIEGVELLANAESYFSAHEQRLAAAKCATHAARGHLVGGRYAEALSAIERSSTRVVEHERTTESLRTDLVRADVLLALNLLPEAVSLYSDIERLFRQRRVVHDAAIATRGLAMAHHKLGRSTQALSSIAAARQLFKQVGDQAMEAVTAIEEARLSGCADQGEIRGAADRLGELGRRPEQIGALLSLLDLDLSAGPAETVTAVEALLRVTPVPDLEWRLALHQCPDPQDESERATRVRHLEHAVQVVDDLRGALPPGRTRVAFLGARRDAHEALVGELLDQGRTLEAFERCARARARTLLEVQMPQDPAGPSESTQVVLLYEVIGSEILAFVRHGDDLACHRRLTSCDKMRELQRRLDALANRYEAGFMSSAWSDGIAGSTQELLAELYDELIRPLDVGWHGRTLCVVPVGPVANVPFQALHDGERYLIERAEIVYSPAVATDLCGAGRMAAPLRVLAVGVPDDQAPLIADEIRAVTRLFGEATVLLAGDATVDALRRQIGHHDVCHIACHGEHRVDSPLLSSLTLGDRKLTAAEVADWSLDGQLVVLSACWSGRQDAAGNIDEVLGFTRAFLAAGAAGVIVNRWQVADASALELMTRFYEQLQGSTTASALREVQRSLLAAGWHPHHWAAPSLYQRPVSTSRES